MARFAPLRNHRRRSTQNGPLQEEGMKVLRYAILAFIVCFLVLALTPARVHGQAVNATLVGTISDSTGAVLPAAKVVITETKTGISRSTETNQSGNYVFANLPPGLY